MKKIGFISALVVAMTAVSCVEDINTVQPQNGSKTFEATFDPTASKAVLKPGADESKVEWNKGDKVSVLVGEGKYMYEAQSDGLTTTLATAATDVPSEGTFYGLYPYDENAVLASGVVTTSLPASQTAVLGSFSTHLAVAQSTSGAMAFKNVCGLVKVNVSSDNVTSIVFEGNSGEVVAGAINVTVADAPAWAVVEGQGATSVTLLPAEGQATIATGDYYFAVLPQTFAAGFKVTSNKNDGYSVVRNVETEVVVERSGMVAGKSFGISGKGTEAEPYVIMTPQDMVDMRSLAKLGGETWFKLGADIDMKGVTNYVPVNYNDNFERKIHFDGADHTIDNFTNNFSSYPSLFGVLYGSCRNLKMTNVDIDGGSSVTGVIGGYIGTNDKPAVVENVSVQGKVTTTAAERTGGFCGNSVDATFTNCTADVVIVAAKQIVGGFIGRAQKGLSMTNCTAKVDITTNPISNYVGGLVGWLNTDQTVNIVKCSVEGKIVGRASSGGLVAATATGAVNFDTCYAACTISGKANVGGLVGNWSKGGEMKNCYFTGSVTGEGCTGGLIGNNTASAVITDSYADAEVSAAGNASAGIIGASTDAIITRSYFKGKLTSSFANQGGIAGTSTNASISDCYVDAEIVNKNNQSVGGIGGILSGTPSIKNCYFSGRISGRAALGGIAGLTNNASTVTLQNCVVWAENISATKSDPTQYSSGAVIGNLRTNSTTPTTSIKNNWRRADLQFNDYSGLYPDATSGPETLTNVLVDHDDCEGSGVLPPFLVPQGMGYSNDWAQMCYHGKAAAADATVSSIAKSIGWDETIWDFSGSLPVLK